MCFRLRVRPRCPLTRRLDSQTQQPLLSSLLDKLQEVKWGGKACSYYGFVNSHVLLSSTIQQVLKELELPEHLTANGLLEALNLLLTREEFEKL